jgi:ATP-dependent DNA helicase DinG
MSATKNIEKILGQENKIREVIRGANFRVGQFKMAQIVLQTMQKGNGEATVIEAPTGSGKSMGLLIPACSLITENPMNKVIITTGTKALQNQLTFKDLPAVHKLFPNIKVSVLLGRDNYISPALLNDIRLRDFINPTDEVHAKIIARNMDDIFAALGSKQGTLEDLKTWWSEHVPGEELSPRVIKELITPQKEDLRMESYHQRAILRANQADIVVMNHSLVAAFFQHCGKLIQEPNPNYVGLKKAQEEALKQNSKPYTEKKIHLLVDECHQLPNAILEQETVISTTQEWKDWAKIAMVGDNEQIKKAVDAIEILEKRWKEFNPTNEGINPTKEMLDLATRTTHIVELLLEELKDATAMGNLEASERINKAKSVVTLFKKLPNELTDSPNFHSIALTKQNHICFESKTFVSTTTLNKIYSMAESIVLTSATALYGNNTHTKQIYGLDELDKKLEERRAPNKPQTATVHSLPSPFNLKEATKAFIMQGIPPTNEGLETFAECCKPIIRALKGRTLILFSSYSALKKAAELLKTHIEESGAQMLVQSQQVSAHHMAASLRKNPNIVLLGTESLRTGIDIPGNHLSAVIIHKLPFTMPNRYIEEKTKYIERTTGKNYFKDIAVPETANSLKQAIGRLIRTHTDTGILLIADDRLIKASYAKELLEANTAYNWMILDNPKELPPENWIRNHCKLANEQVKSR